MKHPYKLEVEDLLFRLEEGWFEPSEVYDGGETHKLDSWSKALEHIMGVDVSHLYVKTPYSGTEVVLVIIMGNGPGELVSDYHMHEELDPVLELFAREWDEGKAMLQIVDRLEKRIEDLEANGTTKEVKNEI